MGKVMLSGVAPQMKAPISGILASDLAVGSVVKLMENGVATEYLVVNQGKPSGSSLYDASCDGTWLLRKEIKEKRIWGSGDACVLETSDIHTWLNSDMFAKYDSIAQSAIKQVKIPYRSGGGPDGTDKSGANGLSCKVFLLSGYEVGWTQTDDNGLPIDGAKLDYFASGTSAFSNNKRIANLNGSPEEWRLRSPYTVNVINFSFGLNNDGSKALQERADSTGIRPAVILPSNALFDTNTMLLKGVA